MPGEDEKPPENGYQMLHLFEVMLLAMERRLVERMEENSELARSNWAKHDAELATNTRRIVERFEALEKQLGLHLEEARLHRVASDARVRPVRSAFSWTWDHWRDIVLLAIGLFALVSALVEAGTRL